MVTAIIRSEDGFIDSKTFRIDAVHAVHHVTFSELTDFSSIFLRRFLEVDGPFKLSTDVHADSLHNSTVCTISFKYSGLPLDPRVRTSRIGKALV